MAVENWVIGAGRAVLALARRLGEDARGNVAMIFALSLPVLVLMTMGGVDLHRASSVRMNLQDALDAAALAAARSPHTDNVEIQRVGMAALKANLQAHPSIMLREADTRFVLDGEGVVKADAKVDVKALVANIFLPPYGTFMDDYLPVGAHSQVNRSSKNIEVSLVLDITGSMSGSRIRDLKTAAKELIDLVVQDLQTPYYTRAAVVPYSSGVNLGTYAAAARGAATGSTTITNVAWASAASKSISGITRASPGVITASGHGLVSGDFVWIAGVRGMTQINDRAYRVVRINNNTFSLEAWSNNAWRAVNTTSGNGYSNYSSNGTVRKCERSDCAVIVTSAGHGLANGEGVYITEVRGATDINNSPYEITLIDANRYAIDVYGPNWNDYTSGGRSWCGRDGCQWRVFRNMSNNLRAHEISTCASERTGAQAYTDASPSSARVGRVYPPSGNPCPGATIRPLSSDRAAIKTMIDNLSEVGSTAGQIGTAWGWYAIAPNFNSLWPTAPAAGAYNDPDLLKAVVLMTDGEYNTPYNTGVIARDAASGSGGNADKINAYATNGDPFDQAKALCDAMKARGVIVYTVGFAIPANSAAARVMAYCATSSDHAHMAVSGADLSEAFKAIGRDLSRLRIAR